MTAFETAWDIVKELSLRESYDVDDEGTTMLDMRLFDLPDRYNEIPPGEERDITDSAAHMTRWNDLDQEQMDELNPVMRLYYQLTREAYDKGYGSVSEYNPFEENYEAPHNDIINFVDLLEFWSGERAFNSPFGPQEWSPEPEAQDMLRRWREGVAAHAKKYGGA